MLLNRLALSCVLHHGFPRYSGLGVRPYCSPIRIQHTRGTKWRAEWIDPSPGLIDYVDSGQLIIPWKEHKAFLKEEASAESLLFEAECRKVFDRERDV